MITRRFTLKPEHSLALRKVELEMRMSRSNLTFMLDQHLNDPDDSYLDSDEFNDLYERYLMTFNEWERVQGAMIDIITGTHMSSRTYLYENGFLYVTISANEKIPASPEYNTEYTPVKEKFISYTDLIAKLYPKPVDPDAKGKDRILSRTVTFQVTDKCNLACTYCYQINKGTRRMTMDDAKLFIDKLLTGEDGFKEYINPDISPAIVVEFIGGEPFLEIDLIDEIVDYFRLRVIQLRHPWMEKFCVSICSNGVLYTDPRVQKFLQKNKDNISFSVTLDGNKELHDKCRVFPDGGGSYDIAEAATQDWMSRGYYMGSKITISQENLPYIYDALMHIVGLGYDEIHANCVYEAFWTEKDAGKLYELMKKFSDFMLSDKKYRDLDCSLYTRNLGTPKKADDLQNWCFRAGTMILTPTGNVPIEGLKVGDEVIDGDGNIQKIENVITHQANINEVMKIKASGVGEVYTTKNHPFLTKKFQYMGWKGKLHYEEPAYIAIKDVNKKDKIALRGHSFGNKRVDPFIAYIVGRYIGDGWHSTTGYKICCSHKDAAKLDKILRRSGIAYSCDEYPTVEQFNLFKSNEELLNILVQCGERALEKKVPADAFLWDKKSVKQLLKGLFDSDGYRTKDNRQKLSTVSKALAYDIAYLLRGLGYYPLISREAREGLSSIQGREVYVHDRYEVNFSYDKKSTFMRTDKNDDGLIWTTVRKKKEDIEPYEVFNLTVANSHTYVANGAVVHNCGGTGSMLSMDPDGWLYPCIRYMESSLGADQKPMRIGNVHTGLATCKEHQNCVECLNVIDRRSQSTDDCFYCPIAEGCSWCSAFNYQTYGTADKRVTRICPMHKGRVLANVYHWNNYYKKYGVADHFDLWVPRQWAEPIIGKEEYEKLVNLVKSMGGYVNESEEQIRNYQGSEKGYTN